MPQGITLWGQIIKQEILSIEVFDQLLLFIFNGMTVKKKLYSDAYNWYIKWIKRKMKS